MMIVDPDKLALIRPAVQHDRATGTFRAVVFVAPFTTREEAVNAAKAIYAAAIEQFARVGVKPGPEVN